MTDGFMTHWLSIKKLISFIDSMTVSASTATVPASPSDCPTWALSSVRTERSGDQRGTGLQEFMDFARHVEALDDSRHSRYGRNSPPWSSAVKIAIK